MVQSIPWYLLILLTKWVYSCMQSIMVFSHQSKTTTRQWQDHDKTNVEPMHSYDAFHAVAAGPGVKGIIGMHRFNICLVVVLLWCENTIRLLRNERFMRISQHDESFIRKHLPERRVPNVRDVFNNPNWNEYKVFIKIYSNTCVSLNSTLHTDIAC